MAADVVKGIREAIQDLLAPELLELRAEMRANTQRLDDLRSEMREWRLASDRRFEHMEHRLDTYDDVQTLKEQMAELCARQQPSA